MQRKINNEECYKCGVVDSSVHKAGRSISEYNPEYKNKNLCHDCRINIILSDK